MAEAALVHVVDDDASVRNSLAVLLESAGYLGARVRLRRRHSCGRRPGLTAGCVLTDVQMPELNGLELQRRMSELDIRLPVIVMTGHGDVPIAVEAMKAGATDFLEKPFEEPHLLAAVTSAIAVSRRAHDEAAAVAEIAARHRHPDAARAQVLDHLVAGQPNKTIAYDLGFQPAYRRSASGTGHGEDGRTQPAGAGPHDDRGGAGGGFDKIVGSLT